MLKTVTESFMFARVEDGVPRANDMRNLKKLNLMVSLKRIQFLKKLPLLARLALCPQRCAAPVPTHEQARILG